MSALRGRIIGVTPRDIDGNIIARGPGYAMPVETITIVLSVDYVEGDLHALVGHSLAIAPHEQHQKALTAMHDQRAVRQPQRGALLEVDDKQAAPAGPLEETGERASKLEID